jgi:hypothetical protein
LWNNKNNNKCKEKGSSPNNKGFELIFLDEWDTILDFLTDNLNVRICPLKKEILNELIINYEILLFFIFLKRILLSYILFYDNINAFL